MSNNLINYLPKTIQAIYESSTLPQLSIGRAAPALCVDGGRAYQSQVLLLVHPHRQPKAYEAKLMFSLARNTRINSAFKPLAHLRGLKFLAKDYPASPGFSQYSEELERAISESIQKVPASAKLFQKPDGSPRSPEDSELQTAAALGALAGQSRATLLDKFRMTPEQSIQYQENTGLLDPYFLHGRRILDKIPVEDPATGTVTWQVIREGQKEGWENIMYYMYVPGLLGAAALYFFLDKSNLSEWALEELRLRAQEKHGDTLEEIADPAERKRRDDLVVERIISGDYDRLAGLRKKATDLPTSLL